MMGALRVAGIVAALCMASAVRANAQIGPLFDWIHKLSGPQFVGGGGTFSVGYRPGLKLDPMAIQRVLDRVGALRAWERLHLDGPVRVDLDTLQVWAAAAMQQAATLRWDIAYSERDVQRVRTALARIARELPDTGQVQLAALEKLSIAVARARFHARQLLDALDVLAHDPDAVDPGRGVRARLTFFGATDHTTDSTAANIISIRPTVEYLVQRNFAVETGISMSYYSGDIRPFWSFSYPVLLVYRPSPGAAWFWRAIRLGAGVHVFAPFPSGAFNAVYRPVDVGWKVKASIMASLDFSLLAY